MIDRTLCPHYQDAARMFGVPIEAVTRAQREEAKESTFYERLEAASRVGMVRVLREIPPADLARMRGSHMACTWPARKDWLAR